MPYLSSLIKDSAWGVLLSTIPAITPVAWSSFQTGLNPGEHGVFSFRQILPGGSVFFANSTNLKGKSLWEYLSAYGRCVVAINVPITYPPFPVNGCIVSGLLTPSVDSQFTYPASLGPEILRIFGKYLLPAAEDRYRPHEDLEMTLGYLLEMVENRLDVTQYLMQRYDWDLLMVHFQATDMIQHPYWELMTADSRLRQTPEWRQIAQFYAKIDEVLKTLVEAQSTETTTIIISDHGFRSNKKILNLNRWLVENGLISFHSKGKLAHQGVQKAFTIVKSLGGPRLRSLTPKRFRNIVSEQVKSSPHSLIDWSRSSTYFLNSNLYGLLYIMPSIEKHRREEVAEFLIHALSEVHDPETGEPMIDRVLRSSDLYAGSSLEYAPDLIVIPRPPYSVSTNMAPEDNLIRPTKWGRDRHLGTHAEEGLILVHGPYVHRGALPSSRIYDVFPTILSLLGVPLPNGLMGRILNQAFQPDFNARRSQNLEEAQEASRSVGPGPTVGAQDDAFVDYGEEGERMIEERLRGLGYIE